MEKCVQEAIFSTDNLVDYIHAIGAPNANASDSGFPNLLKAVCPSEVQQASFDGTISIFSNLMVDIQAIPILLKLGLRSLTHATSKLTLDQKSILAATFLSSLDAFTVPSSSTPSDAALSVIFLSTRHLQKLCSLLQVFAQDPPPESDTLSAILTSIANACVDFLDFTDPSVTMLAWNALATILTIDFDIILPQMEIFEPRFHQASPEFLRNVVETSFRLRSAVELIQRWTTLTLEHDWDGNVLFTTEISDLYVPRQRDLCRRISEQVQKSLESSQLLDLLQFFAEQTSLKETLAPLKAVLKGIKSHDIITHLQSFIVETLAPKLRSLVHGKHAPQGVFEVYFLLLELSDSITTELYDRKFMKRVLRYCEKSADLFAVCLHPSSQLK